MRKILGIGIVIAIVWYLGQLVLLPLWNSAIEGLGKGGVAVLQFFQSTLWSTPGGNILVAGVVLASAAPCLLWLSRGRRERLIAPGRADQSFGQRVLDHALAQREVAEPVHYHEPLPLGGLVWIVRGIVWFLMAVFAVVILGFALFPWDGVWNAPDLVHMVFVGLIVALLVFFWILHIVALRKAPRVLRHGECPVCHRANGRLGGRCRVCGALR